MLGSLTDGPRLPIRDVSGGLKSNKKRLKDFSNLKLEVVLFLLSFYTNVLCLFVLFLSLEIWGPVVCFFLFGNLSMLPFGYIWNGAICKLKEYWG